MRNCKKSRDNVPHDFLICFSSSVEVFKSVFKKFCAQRARSMAQNSRSGSHFLSEICNTAFALMVPHVLKMTLETFSTATPCMSWFTRCNYFAADLLSK